MKHLIKLVLPEFQGWIEKVLFLFTVVLALGYSFFDTKFAKFGIPIGVHSGWGYIPYFQLKIFVAEIYILILLGLGLVFFLKNRDQFFLYFKNNLKNPVFLLSLFLLVFALVRMSFSFFQNPILSIRNSAFAWYLIIPIVFSLLPVRIEIFERLLRVVLLCSSLSVLISVIYALFFYGTTNITWNVYTGPLLLLYFGITSQNKKLFYGVAVLLGLAIGINFHNKVQRLILLAFLLYPLIIVFRDFSLWKLVLRRILGIFAVAGVSFLAYPLLVIAQRTITQDVMRDYSFFFENSIRRSVSRFSYNNPLIKGQPEDGEGGLQPIEHFRYQMWKDAWGLYKENPVFGIGMTEPVVYRVWAGKKYGYKENIGLFEHPIFPKQPNAKDEPPIAGPHNSYLNAIVRLGVFGFMFICLHLCCLFLLFINKLWGLFTGCFIQILYAFFNVGLEGPTRSFLLLVAIGAVMLLQRNKILMKK